MSPDSTNHRHGGKKKEVANQILSIGKKFENMDVMEQDHRSCLLFVIWVPPLVFFFLSETTDSLNNLGG